MKIKLYSTPTCPYCQMARDFFREKKIEYEDIDVSKDSKKAEEMVEISGQLRVPVISIDDKIMVGFDEKEILKVLEKK